MAKAKNKRNSGLADKVHIKRKGEVYKKKLNPFEVHINKEKLKVLGKKSKHDRGLPGVSRAKAIQKRKETLGTEMKLMNKTNAFIDRRIGEKNTQLSAEDRIVARFAAERAKQHTKKNIYNLADDEILTHRGQTLEQIEKFDDPRSSDDEDDGDGRKFGGLDNDFVSEGHFGGGVLSRTHANDGAKSHKDLIEQLIAESKKRKAEKQKEKEQTLDLTEKLDSEWKDLQPVVLKKARMEEKEETLIDKLLNQAEKKSADYDKMMRELRFEKRGKPSDALKSEEKQAKEEKQKLEQLERDREQRMLGEEENGNTTKIVQPTTKHRSAEDLEDNFELEDEQNFMLAYDKDGNPLVPDHVFKANNVPNSKKFQDGVSDSSSDDEKDDSGDSEGESSDDEESENDEQTQNRSIDDKKSKNESVKSQGVENNEKSILFKKKSSDDEENDESSDADVEETPTYKSASKDKVWNGHTEIVESQQITNLSDNDKDEKSSSEEESNDEEDKNDLNDQKKFDDMKDLESGQESEEEIDAAADADRITSFFNPSSTEGYKLKDLLTGKSPAQQSAAIQKLIKSYDPSLGENNKDLLSKLFVYLLQYVNDTFSNLKEESEVIKSFLVFNKIAPHLYDLAQTNKVSTKKYLVEVLTEKHDDFRKNTKKVPDLETLIFFKLVSLIYPTSDFRHPVTTPSLVFMSEILNLSRYQDVYSISRGLFITALILEYTVLSKRLVPSAINFLRGILYLTANTSILNPIQVVPPFRLHKDVKILKLDDDCSKMTVENKMAAKDLVLNEADNDYKIRCLSTCVDMLREYFDHFNDIEAQGCLFEPHLHLLSRIDLDLYPKKMESRISETIKYMRQNLEVKTYTPMARERKRPKALRLYEPDVQEVFTGSKSYKLSREKAEQNKLQHKYKKEMKGALREIRRDKAFIANVKIRNKIQSDNVRKEKVKQIFKDASIQQGELNKLKRMK